MTAGALTGDRERCLAAGMDDYVSKPVAFEELAATLGRWAPLVGGPAASARTAPAPLDGRVVDELRALDQPGSGFLHGVIGLFLDTTPARLEALAAAARGGDAAGLRALAHGLRSSCGNVGARRMHDLCADIEQRADEGASALLPLVGELLEDFGRVRAALEAEQRRSRPPTPRVKP